jgi:hypothetical protein
MRGVAPLHFAESAPDKTEETGIPLDRAKYWVEPCIVRLNWGAIRGMNLRNIRLLVFLVAMGFVGSHSAQAQENDIVWVWNSHCPKPIFVALRVSLDGIPVYATSLPLCRWERRFQDGKSGFQFTPNRPLIWYGYRSDEADGKADPGDPTAAGSTLTVDLWQTGGESNAIELGYSVESGGQLYMNSLISMSPNKAATTTLAPGLVLETRPERRP